MFIGPKINRDIAEVIMVTVYNGEGATMAAGAAVCWDTSTDADGLLVRQPDTGKLWNFAGVLDASMASVSTIPGLAQSYGYRSSALVFQTDTSMAAGLPLVPIAAKNYMDTTATATASSDAVVQQPIYGFLVESVATSSASAARSTGIFVRAM